MDEKYDLDALLKWRTNRDERYRSHYSSPIPEDDLPAFTGLRYFEPDPTMAMRGPFLPADGIVEITSSTGGTSGYRQAGYVDLSLGGDVRRLAVLEGDDDELFIPFRDATSGLETYGGGRYVGASRSGSRSAFVDFNRATNPLCAYDDDFSCPLPPPQNWLPIPIRAGEMAYRSP